MRKSVVKLDNVSMTFRLTTVKIDSIKEFVLKKLKHEVKYKEFKALSEIDLEIFEGDRVGIIGHNGAGKSTLLKLISGVMKPTQGSIYIDGNIAPLLELGAGFDPEMTGKDNIYLNGSILGKSKEFLESNCDSIVEYAELGDFINIPIKNYSSGMKARLGFSIATTLDPDILIVDEVLGVGDERFKKKSTQTMEEMIKSGKTIILVSHNLRQMQMLCDRIIWLDKGRIRAEGDPFSVCAKYREFMDKGK